jgi:hypothetical protein
VTVRYHGLTHGHHDGCCTPSYFAHLCDAHGCEVSDDVGGRGMLVEERLERRQRLRGSPPGQIQPVRQRGQSPGSDYRQEEEKASAPDMSTSRHASFRLAERKTATGTVRPC